MLPLFRDSDPDGLRDVLEGRLLWVAHRALHGGLDVVVDFGLWGRQERAALADLSRHAGGRCEVRHCHVEEEERRARFFQAPDEDELAGQHAPRPPAPYKRWAAWAAVRWPSLPSWDRPENSGAQAPGPA